MAHITPPDTDRCTANVEDTPTRKGSGRCKRRKLEGYDTCRYHTDENWAGRCAAKAKSTQKQCRKDAVKGYNVCGIHGAGSPYKGRPGGRQPSVRRPRLQRALPPELGRRFEEAVYDPHLLSLRSNIALSETLLLHLTDNMSDSGSIKQWGNLRKVASKLQSALLDESEPLIHKYSRQLVEMIEEGADQRDTRKEINTQQEYIRKLKDSEWKRLVDMKQMVTVEESNAVMGSIVMAFNNVTRLFTERLGADHTTEMRKLFGKEVRNLQTLRDNTPRRSKGKATYIDVEVVPQPITAARARKDRAKEQQ